jgi:hypothetical protein
MTLHAGPPEVSRTEVALFRDLEEELLKPEDHISLLDFTVRRLAQDVMLVTYRTTIQNRAVSRLRSSIWKLIEGRWQMIFHQGTPSREHH